MVLLKFLLVFFCLFLLFSLVTSECPPPEAGINFDFSNLPNGIMTAPADPQGRVISYWVSLNCQNTGHCVYSPYTWAACCTWDENGVTVEAGIGDTPGSWQYINPEIPSLGAKWFMANGIDNYDNCNNALSQATIMYECINWPGDDTMSIVSAGSGPECQWIFQVNSMAVCAVNSPPSAASSSGGNSGGSSGGHNNEDNDSLLLSGGSLFLILLLAVIVLYCVIGIAFMRLKKGATGSEMIPHQQFWRELPGLVKDGCVFSWRKLASCACQKGGGSESDTTSFVRV